MQNSGESNIYLGGTANWTLKPWEFQIRFGNHHCWLRVCNYPNKMWKLWQNFFTSGLKSGRIWKGWKCGYSRKNIKIKLQTSALCWVGQKLQTPENFSCHVHNFKSCQNECPVVAKSTMGFLEKWGIYQQKKGHSTLFIAYLEQPIHDFTRLHVQIPLNMLWFACVCMGGEIFV